ncbi:MAG: hypothetical protein R3C09_11010 [Pirellulaceae bacterium]
MADILPNITEVNIDAELVGNIEFSAQEAASLLGLDADATALDRVRAVDKFVYAWQKGERPQTAEGEDLSMTLGSLWGQQLTSELGWQWAAVTFHDFEDSKAVGVFSPDRALAIYPFHFVYGCMENSAPVTILLAYNLLVDGSKIPPLPKNGYENVMDNVHHVVPRD